jgi:negative regulator of sigma E activity
MATLAANTDILTQTIQGLGYASVVDFAREQTKSILQQKIAYYQSRIDFFEQKYGLNFAQFGEQFAQLKSHSILEKEDDSLIWETSIDAVDAYCNDLLALNQ